MKGQVRSVNDRVTQEEVVRYLLLHEEGTQRRRRRAQRRRKRPRHSDATPTSLPLLPSDSGATLYTTPDHDHSPHSVKGE